MWFWKGKTRNISLVNSDHSFQSEQFVILETLDNQPRHFKWFILLVAKSTLRCSTNIEPELNTCLHQRGVQEKGMLFFLLRYAFHLTFVITIELNSNLLSCLNLRRTKTSRFFN